MVSRDSSPPIPLWVKAPTAADGIIFSEIPVIPSNRLPSFMVIGAAKAGTTALNQYLSQHPQIFMCPLKEPHFFSTDQIYSRGLEWYKGLYADAAPGQMCGEASTSYTFFPRTPLTPARIAQVAPEIKFIYLVREPISRVYSACLQALKYQKYVLKEVKKMEQKQYSIEHLIELGSDPQNASGLPDFIQNSQYINQINEYLNFFRKEQLMIIPQEDLAGHPDETLKKIFEFIGVDPNTYQIHTDRVQANTTKTMLEGAKSEQLAQRLGSLPGYTVLKPLIPNGLKDLIKRINQMLTADEQVIPPMSEVTKQRLQEHFLPYNQALEEYLQRDLSHWQLSTNR